jgi:cold shock CspA family protein
MTTIDDPPAPRREFGHVIFFSEDKGFGFLRSDTRGADVWFHASYVQNRQSLQAAQRVSYLLCEDQRGRLQATDVRIED